MNKSNNYINHIVINLDSSSSMNPLTQEVIKVVDNQIEHLAERSKSLDQETRVSVYTFANKTDNIVYDKDVLRLPSIAQHYKPQGQTALIDATLKTIEDLQKTPELYGDHSFLLFCITDGENNINNHLANNLQNKIQSLPENWTVAVLVPNQKAVFEAKKFGFPAQNIQVWSTTNEGIKEVGETIRRTTDNFMRARATGVRGTKSLFNLDVKNLNSSVIKSILDELQPYQYELFSVHKDQDIKSFVEGWTKKDYVKGSSYYQLTKPELLQAYKQIVIQDKASGKVFSGANARKIINLPDYEVRVNPTDFGKFDIYAQSTSSNRKLIGGTKLIVLK